MLMDGILDLMKRPHETFQEVAVRSLTALLYFKIFPCFKLCFKINHFKLDIFQ